MRRQVAHTKQVASRFAQSRFMSVIPVVWSFHLWYSKSSFPQVSQRKFWPCGSVIG